jgi:hypothetical protein
MALQIVYVLTNPAMPGFVKIGRTSADDAGQRLAQLYTTGVPFPFELVFACKVPNSEEVERALHLAFSPNRPNAKREFFNIEPEQAIAILKLLHVEDATQEISQKPTAIPIDEVQAGKHYKARRPNLNFREVGIPMDAALQFTESNATVVVTGDRLIQYEGEEMSLTAITRQLLALEHNVQPSPYWTYEGKSLKTMYDETYAED